MTTINVNERKLMESYRQATIWVQSLFTTGLELKLRDGKRYIKSLAVETGFLIPFPSVFDWHSHFSGLCVADY